MFYRKCPICGFSNIENGNFLGKYLGHVNIKLPDEIKIDGNYDIVQCEKCGSCYGNVNATEEDYSDYYSIHNNYVSGQGTNDSANYSCSIISRTLKQLDKLNSSILDIGFGTGKLLKYLKNDGFDNLCGVDPSEKSVLNLKDYGIESYIGNIYQSVLNKKFDVVVFTQVLEHLLNPYEAIVSIRDNYLNKSGILIISWPYFDDLIACSTYMYNNFNHEHINFFSRDNVDLLLARCGFYRIAHHISLEVCLTDSLQYSNISVYKFDNDESHNLRDILSDIKKDFFTAHSLLEYISRSNLRLEYAKNLIRDLKNSKKQIAIYGVGSLFMNLVASTELLNCNILYLVDNNTSKQNTYLFKNKVSSPKVLENFDGVILVLSMVYGLQIENELKNKKNILATIIRL